MNAFSPHPKLSVLNISRVGRKIPFVSGHATAIGQKHDNWAATSALG